MENWKEYNTKEIWPIIQFYKFFLEKDFYNP
jgi:hypothetical protein